MQIKRAPKESIAVRVEADEARLCGLVGCRILAGLKKGVSIIPPADEWFGNEDEEKMGRK